jgi:hypothetical protein
LKADYNPNKTTSLDYYEWYKSDATKIREMNPDWARNRGNSESTWNYNEKAAAMLCEAENGNNIDRMWSSYYDSNKANYVIGSPSVEMYVDSYNDIPHTIGNNSLEVRYRATNYPGYIYILNGGTEEYNTIENTIDYKDYGSMYSGYKGIPGNYYWWLSSPTSAGVYNVCNVQSSNLYGAGTSQVFGISPIVSLKHDFDITIDLEMNS